MHRTTLALATLAALAAGCGEFEVQSIVLDMRILGIQLEPPEILVSEEAASNPDSIEELNITACALVADPADSRSLTFEMAMCAETGTRRCDDPTLTRLPLGSGTVGDPEQDAAPGEMCMTVPPDPRLITILQEAVERNAISEYGGVIVQFELAAYPEGGSLNDAVYGIKRLLVAPRLPAERQANNNPSLDDLTITREEDDQEVSMPLGRCRDVDPLEVEPGEKITFLPVETEGAREDYVLPTFDDDVRMFTENLTYRWYATHGKWQREATGGPRDAFGNDPPLDSAWTAPEDLEVIGDGLDMSVWLVQRDERGGLAWYETCVRVVP